MCEAVSLIGKKKTRIKAEQWKKANINRVAGRYKKRRNRETEALVL